MGKHKRARDLEMMGAYFRAHPEEKALGATSAVDEAKPEAIDAVNASDDSEDGGGMS